MCVYILYIHIFIDIYNFIYIYMYTCTYIYNDKLWRPSIMFSLSRCPWVCSTTASDKESPKMHERQ